MENTNMTAEEAYRKAYECNQREDFDRMIEYLGYAAEKGFPLGMMQYGYMLLFKDKKEDAVKWLVKAGEAGLTDAYYTLGNCFYYGEACIGQDYNEAVKYFKKAAESGHPKAQCNLGACFYYGQGTETDYAEAFKWYSKSAAQGEPDGQFNTGVCYEKGQGVEHDAQKAFEYFSLAARQGNERAEARRNLYIAMSK